MELLARYRATIRCSRCRLLYTRWPDSTMGLGRPSTCSVVCRDAPQDTVRVVSIHDFVLDGGHVRTEVWTYPDDLVGSPPHLPPIEKLPDLCT